MLRLIHIAAVIAVSGTSGVCDDHGGPPPKQPQAMRPNAPKNGGAALKKDGLPKAGVRFTNPANPVERLYRMTPEQRDRALEKLPPQQQERMRAQLKWFDGLAPEQQQVVLNRVERLAALPPEKRREWLTAMQDFQRLEPERRPQIQLVLRRLQNATEEQRKAFFDSPRFHSDYTAEEQKIILDLSQIMPGQ
jgi:hypothetical protein